MAGEDRAALPLVDEGRDAVALDPVGEGLVRARGGPRAPPGRRCRRTGSRGRGGRRPPGGRRRGAARSGRRGSSRGRRRGRRRGRARSAARSSAVRSTRLRGRDRQWVRPWPGRSTSEHPVTPGERAARGRPRRPRPVKPCRSSSGRAGCRARDTSQSIAPVEHQQARRPACGPPRSRPLGQAAVQQRGCARGPCGAPAPGRPAAPIESAEGGARGRRRRSRGGAPRPARPRSARRRSPCGVPNSSS